MASIQLASVSLAYPVYDVQARSLKRAIARSVGGRLQNRHGHVRIQALSGLDLRLGDGDRLAVIGHNGAGKSTLLKVLSGIYHPDRGDVMICGRVSSLTDITMGMDLDATGYQNIVLRGVILGLTYRQAEAVIPEIEAFTELGDYLHLPLRSYSTGMLVRLGFATSTASEPDILIMDEMIGAGDLAFTNKATLRLNAFMAQAKIMVLASHDLHLVRRICNRAILLDHGQITASGRVDDVVEAYRALQQM